MIGEKINKEFRLKKIDETIYYFIKQIKQSNLTSKKHRKVCICLNYTDNLFILLSTITGCVPISAFFLLAGIPIGISSSALGLKS